jgi:hypothetical protein
MRRDGLRQVGRYTLLPTERMSSVTNATLEQQHNSRHAKRSHSITDSDKVFSVASIRNPVWRHEPDASCRNWSSEEANLSALREAIHNNVREEYIREDSHRCLAAFRLISILTYLQVLGDDSDAATGRTPTTRIVRPSGLLAGLGASTSISTGPSVALQATIDSIPKGESVKSEIESWMEEHEFRIQSTPSEPPCLPWSRQHVHRTNYYYELFSNPSPSEARLQFEHLHRLLKQFSNNNNLDSRAPTPARAISAPSFPERNKRIKVIHIDSRE